MKLKNIILYPFKMLYLPFKKLKPKKKLNSIEQDFLDGKVLLLQDKRDYQNYEEFKTKTEQNKMIKDKLIRLHGK